MIQKAIKIIEDLIKEVKVGEVYLGKVVRIEKFGAFVNLIKGKRSDLSIFLNWQTIVSIKSKMLLN